MIIMCIYTVYIYNHPGVDRIWDFQPFSHSRKEFWTCPYSIYSRMTTYREIYIYIDGLIMIRHS